MQEHGDNYKSLRVQEHGDSYKSLRVQEHGDSYKSLSPSSKEINENKQKKSKWNGSSFLDEIRGYLSDKYSGYGPYSLKQSANVFTNAGTSVPNSTTSHPRRS